MYSNKYKIIISIILNDVKCNNRYSMKFYLEFYCVLKATKKVHFSAYLTKCTLVYAFTNQTQKKKIKIKKKIKK